MSDQISPNQPEWEPNERQRALIQRLSQPPMVTLRKASAELGIPEGTAKMWHRTPAFRVAVDKAQREQLTNAVQQRIATAADEAFGVLLDIMRDDKASPYVRLQAVQDILDRSLGTATQRQEISGKNGGAVETKATVIHEHNFDFDAFRRTFTDVLHGSGGAAPRDDGSQEPVDPA